MKATLKATATAMVILALVAVAMPAHAAGPRGGAVQRDGGAVGGGAWSFGTWLLDWLGVGGDGVPDPGLEQVVARGGVGMDPDGAPTPSGGVGMDPDGTPSATNGGSTGSNG